MALPIASWRSIVRDLKDLRSSAIFLYGGALYTSFYTVWLLRKGVLN